MHNEIERNSKKRNISIIRVAKKNKDMPAMLAPQQPLQMQESSYSRIAHNIDNCVSNNSK